MEKERTTPISQTHIKRIRKSYGLTQEQLATKLKIRRPYLAKIETGRRPVPDYLFERFVNLLSESDLSSSEREALLSLLHGFLQLRDEEFTRQEEKLKRKRAEWERKKQRFKSTMDSAE